MILVVGPQCWCLFQGKLLQSGPDTYVWTSFPRRWLCFSNKAMEDRPHGRRPHGRRFTATGMSNSLKFLSFFWQHIYACASSEIESSNWISKLVLLINQLSKSTLEAGISWYLWYDDFNIVEFLFIFKVLM